MSRLFFILLLFSFGSSFAQPSDFIIIKKKGKTIHSYYPGTQIEFITTGGVYKNALINKIKNDTLYLQEFLVRQLPTQLGFNIIDTAGSFRYAYHYNQIKSIGSNPQKGFNISGSGAALLGGGILLTLANAVVYVADRDKFSPALMGASAGLGLAGYFLSKAGSTGIVIGKKNYHIEYMKMTTDSK